ncbi:MAG TPA: Ig-like domain repeat protein [Acidimicrobiales bacterium]|nr:Ig-like domain repeat protein [Acidimicrobiales bacterium]
MAQELDLQLVEGGGQLRLRGSEEPYQIENPTSITGTIDAPDPDTGGGTGAITAGTFTTPQVSIVQSITSPLVADVYIDADFTQTIPQNLTGTVDENGVASVRMALTVDLHVDVGRDPLILDTDCTAGPIDITLSSMEPYDPVTGEVTLADGNFSIPDAGGPDCEPNVKGAINDQLAGPGHAISLTMQGDIPLPQTQKDPTLTTLAVAPEGGAQAGGPVDMTATVARGPDAVSTEDPSGFVDFRADGEILGTVPVAPDGTAVFTTSDLPAGTHALTARYGSDEVFGSSTSTPAAFTVWSNPALTWDLPEFVQLFATPTDFTVAALNTGFGEDLVNVRLDVTIQRAQGNGPIGPVSGSPRITLDRLEGPAATPVPLTFTGSGVNQRLAGSIGAGTGVPLAEGASLTEALRLGFPNVGTVSPTACGATNRLCPGPLRITFTLVRVDPGTGAVQATLASSAGDTLMTEATRRTSTITAGNAGFPPVIPATPAVTPHTVRAGNNIKLNAFNVNPVTAGVSPSGTVSFFIDSQPVGVLPSLAPLSAGYRLAVPCCVNNSYSIPVPPTTTPGTHKLTVRYSGNSLLQPSFADFSFEVAHPVAPVYECERIGLNFAYVGRANVVASASVPSVAVAGKEVTLVRPELRLLLDRGPSIPGSGIDEVFSMFTELEVVYGTGGTSSAGSVTRTNNTRMDAAGDPDQVAQFNGLSMAVTPEGEPGEVVPITIESFKVHFDGPGMTMICNPVGDPITLGQVTVAGTTLSVSPTGTVRAGTQVTLDAVTAPAPGGFVEFLDGATTIGVVDVNDRGEASMTTADLPVGERSLTARYLGGLTVPVTTSGAVPLTVIDAFDCAAFTQAGNAAVVRLVYLELLGRCPDQIGFDHWTGRLNGGASASSFARSISATDEAVGRVVDDAYETMLGRPADPSGRAFWIDRLQASGRYDQLLADLAASPEFWSKAGATNTGFVTRVYDRLLGRTPDTAGLNHWVGRLDTGTSRRALVLTLANLDEPLGRLVDDAYDEILGRAPFAAERTDGITYLRATGSRSGLYAQLIGTTEFHTRAQGHPNPED